ncbi:hypothetical protein MHK_000619 [Candidatus Magnetomorum sp. HK-1]|nr:hypothetical protein MHK_004817 [Candidatus Magnetomorum sp. HK-1]KPA19163.1 hypothetical protein MHK_000619 [Candidatus Magnetomorum sp. HK-1]
MFLLTTDIAIRRKVLAVFVNRNYLNFSGITEGRWQVVGGQTSNCELNCKGGRLGVVS